MNFLPKEIKWVNPYELSSNGLEHILIAVHKHSVRDWEIIFGWIEPIDDYTDYKIMGKPNGLGRSYPDMEIKKEEILAIGIFKKYSENK